MNLIDKDKLIEDLHNHYEVRNPKQNALMDEVCMIALRQPTVLDTDNPEPEPMKNILVVYRFFKKCGDIGIGRCHHMTNAKLPLSIGSIKRIEESLEKDFHYKNVVLLNYFLLGDE